MAIEQNMGMFARSVIKMEIVHRCELCGFSGEELNIRERDDDQGQPHLICEGCWERLLQDDYEPTQQDLYDMEVAAEMD